MTSKFAVNADNEHLYVQTNSTRLQPLFLAVVLATLLGRYQLSRGVAGNSGAPGQISKSSPLSLPLRRSPYPPSSCPFLLSLTFLSCPSRPSLLPLPRPYYSQPFPSPFLSPFPLITARRTGERYSSPTGPWRIPAAKRIFVQFTAQNLQIC